MGHMNALKRIKRETKSGRDHRETFWDTLEFFFLAMALALHEEPDPYGKMRCERVANKIQKIAMDFCNTHGDDCALYALRYKCREFGFEVDMR